MFALVIYIHTFEPNVPCPMFVLIMFSSFVHDLTDVSFVSLEPSMCFRTIEFETYFDGSTNFDVLLDVPVV